MKWVYIVLGLTAAIGALAENRLDVFPVPEGTAQNGAYTVWVRQGQEAWKKLHTYKAETRHHSGVLARGQCAFVVFDFEGEAVTVRVRRNKGAVESAVVRPLRNGIRPEVEDNDMIFTLKEPKNLSLEVNGEIYDNLFIFAGAPEKNRPEASDPDVVYFAPGVHRLNKPIKLKAGQTLYLAGGAFVEFDPKMTGTRISARKQSDIRIAGRGVLSMPGDRKKSYLGIHLFECDRVHVEGIIYLKEFMGWCNKIQQCRDVVYDNVRLISSDRFTDGIDVCSSDRVLVKKCMFRTGDDTYDVKAYNNVDCRNVVFEDCAAWSDGWGRPVHMGGEARCDVVENIVYRNIDVLHYNPLGQTHGAITLLNNDHAVMRNILYENIVVEDVRNDAFFIEIGCRYHKKWSKTPGDEFRGSIENVTFRNILFNGENSMSFYGYNAENRVSDIHFENVRINGERCLSEKDARMRKNDFVENITFE